MTNLYLDHYKGQFTKLCEGILHEIFLSNNDVKVRSWDKRQMNQFKNAMVYRLKAGGFDFEKFDDVVTFDNGKNIYFIKEDWVL